MFTFMIKTKDAETKGSFHVKEGWGHETEVCWLKGGIMEVLDAQ